MSFVFADRYECSNKLGSGTFGEVWQARDRHTGRDVAIKLFRQGTPFAAAADEAQSLAALQSPHILEVWNADVYTDIPYLVTAIAESGSVEDHLGTYGIGAAKAVRWARHALVGVALCHARDITHRDIKPSNIFLNSNADGLLGDFGVAVRTDASGLVPADGDPRIRPPEAYTAGFVDKSADTYAVGVSLYWMLTGSCPFEGPLPADQATAVIMQRQPRVRAVAPHVPQNLALKVEKAMNEDPANRYDSAQQMHDDLGRASLGTRTWQRVPPHPTHEMCWSGARPDGSQALEVCVESDGNEFTVTTRRQSGSRTRLSRHCGSARREADLQIRLRKIFGDVG